jgi:TnpA family transposase
MTIQSDLLAEIEPFLEARGMSATAFGRAAVNDGKFIARLRASENMTLATLDKARGYLHAQRNLLRLESATAAPQVAA